MFKKKIKYYARIRCSGVDLSSVGPKHGGDRSGTTPAGPRMEKPVI